MGFSGNNPIPSFELTGGLQKPWFQRAGTRPVLGHNQMPGFKNTEDLHKKWLNMHGIPAVGGHMRQRYTFKFPIRGRLNTGGLHKQSLNTARIPVAGHTQLNRTSTFPAKGEQQENQQPTAVIQPISGHSKSSISKAKEGLQTSGSQSAAGHIRSSRSKADKVLEQWIKDAGIDQTAGNSNPSTPLVWRGRQEAKADPAAENKKLLRSQLIERQQDQPQLAEGHNSSSGHQQNMVDVTGNQEQPGQSETEDKNIFIYIEKIRLFKYIIH